MDFIRSYIFKFLFSYLLVVASFAISQNCECSSAVKAQNRFKQLLTRNEKDSVSLILNSIQKDKSEACQIQYNIFLAEKAFTERDYDSLTKTIQTVENLIRRSKCPNSIYLDLFIVKGLFYFEKDVFDSSASNYLQAIRICEGLKDSSNLAKVHGYMGSLYGKMGETRTAIAHIQKSINISENIGEYDQRAGNYGMLYNCYIRLSSDNKGLLFVDSMFYALQKAYYYIKKTNTLPRLSSIYHKYAGAYIWIKKYDQADKYIDSAIYYAIKFNNLTSLTSSYGMRVHLCKDLKKYREALSATDSVIKYATKLQTNLTLSQSYKNKYEIYKQLNDYKSALNAHEVMVRFSDSLQVKERSETVNELEKKYNQVKNEKEINELKQKEEINTLQIRWLFAISVIAVLVILVIIFFYRQSVVKNKLRIIETEQRLNRARMNPHFFFNALGSLQNLALNESKRTMLPTFISKFSRIMRQSLESTFNEMDTIENEIIFLTEYMELQKLRSENRFSYSFVIDDAIEQSDMLIPGMILQPFVENSIEHGFKNILTEGEICIEFKMANNQLNVVITDNGDGITHDLGTKAYPSRATQIITDRLYLLNKQYKTNAKFALTSNSPKGIRVSVELPILYKN